MKFHVYLLGAALAGLGTAMVLDACGVPYVQQQPVLIGAGMAYGVWHLKKYGDPRL